MPAAAASRTSPPRLPAAAEVDADEAGMGQHRQAAAVAEQAHGGVQREPAPVHPGGSAAAQVEAKGLRDGVHIAAAHQSEADVRAADGAVAGRLREIAWVERQAESGQPLDDARVALVAVAAQLRELFFKGGARGAAEEVAEHVHRHAFVLEIDLDARDDPEAQALACGQRLRQPVHRVVIGDGDGREAHRRRPPPRAAPESACRPRRWCACGGRSCRQSTRGGAAGHTVGSSPPPHRPRFPPPSARGRLAAVRGGR